MQDMIQVRYENSFEGKECNQIGKKRFLKWNYIQDHKVNTGRCVLFQKDKTDKSCTTFYCLALSGQDLRKLYMKNCFAIVKSLLSFGKIYASQRLYSRASVVFVTFAARLPDPVTVAENLLEAEF